MGIHIIKMPDIGEGIAEVELVAWHVKVGDMVAEDQLLADVMTDKATVEIPSSVAGKVLALGGAVGQVMAVGSEVIRIEVEGAGNLKPESAAAPAIPAQAAINSVADAKPAAAATEPVAAVAALSTPAKAAAPAPTATNGANGSAPARNGNGSGANATGIVAKQCGHHLQVLIVRKVPRQALHVRIDSIEKVVT